MLLLRLKQPKPRSECPCLKTAAMTICLCFAATAQLTFGMLLPAARRSVGTGQGEAAGGATEPRGVHRKCAPRARPAVLRGPRPHGELHITVHALGYTSVAIIFGNADATWL